MSGLIPVKRAFIIGMVFGLFILSSHQTHLCAAAPKGEEIYTRLLESSPELKKVHVELDEVYKSCMSSLNEEDKVQLRNKQRSWLKERRGILESNAGDLKALETTIIEMTKLRIEQLKSIVPAFSPPMSKDTVISDLRTPTEASRGKISNEILSVSLSAAGNAPVDVGKPINVSWSIKQNQVSSDNSYEFVILSMPNSVRLKGSGFLVIPPQQNLPFDIKHNPDKLRVVFPLYLLNFKRNGSFAFRPLVAGNFDIDWSYIALDRKTKTIAISTIAANQTASIDVIDNNPTIVIQDRIGGDTPKEVLFSHSNAYELRVYEGRFEIYDVVSGRLIIQKAGLYPKFSPTSRFLVYFDESGGALRGYGGTLRVIDMLNGEIVQEQIPGQGEIHVVAWSNNDSFMILGFDHWGELRIRTPYLDGQKEIGPEMMGYKHKLGWDTGLVYDVNTALVCFSDDGNTPIAVNLVNDFEKNALTLPKRNLYNVIELWPAYLNKLGLRLPQIPGKGWNIPGGYKISHGEIDVNFKNDHSPADEKRLKSLILEYPTKKVSSISHGASGTVSSTSKAKFAQSSVEIETALVNRLKEKGLGFSTNRPVAESGWGADNSLGILPKIRSSINKDIKTMFEDYAAVYPYKVKYWQYPKGAPDLTTVVQVDQFTGGSGMSFEGAMFILDSKGGLIDLQKKVFDYLKPKIKGGSPKPLNGGTSDSWERSTPLPLHLEYLGHPKNDVRLFASPNDILMLCHVDAHSIILYDTKQNRILAVISDVAEAHGLQSLRLSQDGRFILQINKGGRFFVCDIQKSKRVLSGKYLDDEWVIYNDEGFYDATTEGGHFVSWYYPGLNEYFDFNQFESVFKRPNLIQDTLSGNLSKLTSVKPASPPRVILPSHAAITESSEKSYMLNASVSAQDSVKTFRVFVNGEPVKELPVGARNKELSVEVPLVGGMNRVSAVAYNETGFSSNIQYVDVMCSNTSAPKPDLYVFTVGISQYPNLPREWQLSYAHTDAANLAAAFKAQEGKVFGNVYTKTLVNLDATAASITAELSAFQKAAKKDLVIVMLAGHGVRAKDGTFYFLTSKGNVSSPESGDGAISWELLGKYLEKIPGRVVLLLDACHSGGITTETVVPNDDLAQRLFARGKGGITVFAASKGRQVSMESPDVGGGFGVFTYGIVQALNARAAEADTDGNGFVEWNELVGYVSAFVYDETRGEQRPWLARSEIFGDFPLAVRKK